jgi:DNA-directed RNA polymerase I subunit RPA1
VNNRFDIVFIVLERLKEIVEMQLRLVDAGYDIEAQELEDQKILYASVMKLSTKKSLEDQDEGMNTSEKENKAYTKMMKKYAKLMEREPVNHCGGTKNTEAIRMAIVNSTIAASSLATSTKCIHCHSTMRRVRYSYKKLVVTVSKRDLDTSQMKRDEEGDSKKASSAKTIIASECRDIMQAIFDVEGAFLRILYPILQGAIDDNFDLFFMDVIPVVPPLFRPPNRVRDALLEHPQTKSYFAVVQANNQLRYILALKKSEDGNELLTTPALRQEAENIYKAARGESAQEKIFFKWEELQTAVDMTLDKDMGGKMNTEGAGLKQLIEKKEGLIRMHMMGKRVNFAARTVITPDPNINIDQIGVPEAFALKLTYPVPVTPWNVLQLRKMVMNGPDVHPGACYVESGTGQKALISKDESKREAMADTLLKPERNDGIKIVHRHLVNGDVLLLNRQPTLHRPSIMGHKARILKNEKTFRLHYSNCKSYNADFDGDEMNAHFPQNEVGRSEAYNLANVANNYLVPKDGTPLGGLIQDHMISGVKISLRGRFFSRDDYQQLVYQGLSHKTGDIVLLPPTIIKPIKLWSGKQIFSTIILNLIPENKPPINLTSTAKIGATAWETAKPRKWKAGGTKLEGNSMSEAEVVIKGGKLLVGILDKNHYGATAYSLIHCMFELYGGDVSTQLLSSLTRMFTIFLQWEGFTLGVHDILVLAEADKKRTKIVNESRVVGKAATCQVLDIPEDTPDDELVEKLEEAYAKDPKFRTTLDRKYKSTMDSFTNNINKTCLPAGLLCKFPDNNLQLMVMSGAKGSTVNTMQISCLLGQIELEGKRPPVMISGKSLPSFPMFECSPKSGGFIDGRFMTGIQPQDFFFHCMAGREGLIDTAVKTSRSGYLQRCLIKHLEGLTVSYDGTVRDSDNTVVQFMYGEDGMDILKSQFLKLNQMSFLNENRDAIVNDEILSSLRNLPEVDEKIHKIMKRVKTYKKRHGSTIQRPVRSENRLVKKCPPTVTSQFPPNRFYGAVSEAAEEILDKFIKTSDCDDEKVRDMMYVKSARCLAEPGEPVGIIAAQSIGEPSTQMTLNTFHFAGRGDMNVTLGIPRLREILMMASANIKTPSMEIPFLNQNSETLEKTSEKFRIRLNQVTLADVIEFVKVKSWITLKPTRARNYEFTFNFLPHEAYKNQFMVKPKKIVKFMHQGFINKMFKFIERASKDTGAFIDKEEKESKKTKKRNDDDDGGEDDPGMPAEKKKVGKGSEDSSDEDDLVSLQIKLKFD